MAEREVSLSESPEEDVASEGGAKKLEKANKANEKTQKAFRDPTRKPEAPGPADTPPATPLATDSVSVNVGVGVGVGISIGSSSISIGPTIVFKPQSYKFKPPFVQVQLARFIAFELRA